MNLKDQIQQGIEEAEAAYINSNRLLCKTDWLRRRYRVKPNAVPKGSRTYVSPVNLTRHCDLYAIDDCVKIQRRRKRWNAKQCGSAQQPEFGICG